MVLDIRTHALLERRLTDVAFEHAEHRSALLIGNAIECSFDVAVAGDRLADLARGDQAVAIHRALCAAHAIKIGAVFRMHLLGDLLLHPGGERFVEPQVVPPGQRHRVAGPLVRQLMRSDVERTAHVVGRRIGIEQQQPVAEGDQARVFHGAGGEVRRGEQVELVPRIAEAVVILQRVDDARCFAQHVLHAMALTLGRDAAQLQRLFAILGRRDVRALHDVPRAHTKCHQVRRQRLGGGEGQRLPSIARFFFLYLLGIGHAHFVVGDGQANIERRLEAGLVETGKRVARADRFHLRHRIRLALVTHLVQALQLQVERRGVLEGQGQLLRRELATEIDAHHALFRRHFLVLAYVCLAGSVRHGDLAHLQVATMQPQVIRSLRQLDLDDGGAREILLARINLEGKLVGLRLRPARQFAVRLVNGGRRSQGGAATSGKSSEYEWADEMAHAAKAPLGTKERQT